MEFEELVNQERKAQDAKWGEQNHQPPFWYVILGEEVGEIAEAILEWGKKDLETEIIQAAAVLKAMWESGKRDGWIK